MINNQITRQGIEAGVIKDVLVMMLNSDEGQCFKCRVSKIIKSGDDLILKLKTGKDYPLGHKYIFRSIEEVI